MKVYSNDGEALRFADAVQGLPLLAPINLVRDRGLIVVAPHPDDESLGCGGLLAWAAEHAVPTRVVFLTDGEQSHPQSRCDVGGIRRKEAECACGVLGIRANKIRFLGLPDTGLETLAGPARKRAVQWLRQLVSARGPSLVTVTTDMDPHGDHRAACALVKEAIAALPDVELMTYPVWSWLATDIRAPLKGARIAVGEQLSVKRQALCAYASQQGRSPLDVEGFTLPEELLHYAHTDTEVLLWPS